MIVDPIRHITDILALGGLFILAYALAWGVNAISEAGSKRPAAEQALLPVPAMANDNAAVARPGRAQVDERLAA
jgi:hypothetical protein